MKFKDMVYWNTHAYGDAIRVKRGYIIAVFTALCLATFGTNWLIPMLPKIIKNDWIHRW